MNTIKRQIQKNIVELMESQHLSIESLSALTTLSQKTITKLLNGEIEPTMGILHKICNVFGLNTCEFFDDIIYSLYIA